MKAKIAVLRDLLKQMQCAMDEGFGDSVEAGKEAMEGLAEGGESIEDKVEGEEQALGMGEPQAEDDELAEAKRAFFKKGPKIAPKKSTMVVMKASLKPKMGRKYG